MKGFLDFKIPISMVIIFMIMIVAIVFGFAYIGTFFNALGTHYPEFSGSGNWMIAVSVLVIIMVVIAYLEIMKRKGDFFFK